MAAGLGFKTFNTGDVLSAADVNGYLMQGVLVFASTAARDAAITAPAEGQFAFTKDTNSLFYYDGAAWVASGATGDIEGVTAGTGISGGGTSGTVTITNSMATAIDAKGDLIGGTGADTFARLAVGANNTVLTADSAEATGLKWAAPAGSTLPAFSAYGNAVNQTLVANVNTKITFNTEEYDTDGCFASNRFTPTKAGYYVISAYVDADSPSSTITRLYLWKNGAAWKYLRSEYGHTGEREMNGTAQVYLNGTTDYVEIYAVSGQATGIYKNSEYGYFQGVGATS